jgi:predicted GIY-YIG superfamily endonuclease
MFAVKSICNATARRLHRDKPTQWHALYCVTSNLPQRAWQHRTGAVSGFAARYGCKTLVWYELHATMPNAIAREKQMKAGSRRKKLALIEALNPTWRDLFEELI